MRLYIVSDWQGKIVRYVRATTLQAAIRAHWADQFKARPASTEEMFQAFKGGEFEVLDAVKQEGEAQ